MDTELKRNQVAACLAAGHNTFDIFPRSGLSLARDWLKMHARIAELERQIEERSKDDKSNAAWLRRIAKRIRDGYQPIQTGPWPLGFDQIAYRLDPPEPEKEPREKPYRLVMCAPSTPLTQWCWHVNENRVNGRCIATGTQPTEELARRDAQAVIAANWPEWTEQPMGLTGVKE